MNIPNFEDIPVIVKRGNDYYWSDEWKRILQGLFQALQQNASEEGLVAPTQPGPGQPNNAITLIQNNTQIINGNTVYTCKFGTTLYDRLNNSIRMAIDNGSGAPIFKTVTLT